MSVLNIKFSLFSAFYAPLIHTISGGFLAAQGLEPAWSVPPPGVSAIDALKDGTADVVQSGPSEAFDALADGEDRSIVHFAQINQMDGFFLTGRKAKPDFQWRRLEEAKVVLFGGGQPLVMFKYACVRAGVDFDAIEPVHVGGAADMDRAFRDGVGDYIQQQGPFPQQLEVDGVGHIVAQIGHQVGVCAFSSLAARCDWLQSDAASAFIRAYTCARADFNGSLAAEIAASIGPYFADIDAAALQRCVAAYQGLGCWTPHVEIDRAAFEATQDIYQATGEMERRFTYEQICAPPPAS
jgi:NitT/TauT family transport system substrate-binding protein